MKAIRDVNHSEAVADRQLKHYVRHIRDETPEACARCYEKTYAQKRRLGLIDGNGSAHLPPRHCHRSAAPHSSLRSLSA